MRIDLWPALLLEIDGGHEPAARATIAALLSSLPDGPIQHRAIRDLILRIGLLSITAPGQFQSLRPLLYEGRGTAPPTVARLLAAQLADDDGTGHEAVLRDLVAQDDLELVKAVAASVPLRTASMIRQAIDIAFLRLLAEQRRHNARFAAAVALAAIGLSPAALLSRAPCPSDGSPAAQAVEQIVAARTSRLRALQTPAVRRARLRVALCVSGQLRGWRDALATWRPFFRGGHDVQVFVHAWRDAGRKLPHYPHYHRSFGGRFLDALDRATALSDPGLLARDYRAVLGWFSQGEPVDAEELCQAYRTRQVVLEDDGQPPFAGRSNSEKMYTKVEACFDLAKASGVSFDVIVRIRPDKALYPSDRFDWASALRLSDQQSAILADYAPVLHPHGGFVMADQFGCGGDAAMAAYSRTASFSRAAWASGLHGFPSNFVPHSNFAYTCLMSGLRIMATPDLHFGPLHDPARMPAETVLALLRQDLAARPANPFDARLLAAAEQDCATQL